MRKMDLRKLTLAILSGAMLFQVPGCAEAAIYVTSLASVVTAGGVIYLVWRVID